jgi:hypothetical protein
VTRLPGSAPGTCFADPHSPWSPPLAPPAPLRLRSSWISPRPVPPLCSPASQLLWRSPTSRARASSATAPRLPDADRRQHSRRPDAGPPKFRRAPSTRDVLLDPGRVTSASHSGTAHVAFDHGDNLRPCDKPISWLTHTPHVVAVYASWPSLPPAHATLATRRLARPYLGRTCTGRSRQLLGAFLHPGYETAVRLPIY